MRKIFYSFCLLAVAIGGVSWAVDYSNVGTNIFATISGVNMPALIGYTTDGSGALVTLGAAASATDTTTVGQNLFATITGVGKVPAYVLYTTDGSGALTPITGGAASQWTTFGAIIYNTGKVFVGSATGDSSASKFQVIQTTAGDQYVASFHGVSGTDSGLIFVKHAAATGTDFQGVTAITLAAAQPINFNPSGGQVVIGSADATMTYNGAGAGTLSADAGGVVTTTSDERLKDIRAPYERGLDDLLKLKGYGIIYNWKKGGKHDPSFVYAGLSAQRLEKGCPECVSENAEGELSVDMRPHDVMQTNSIIEIAERLAAVEAKCGLVRVQMVKPASKWTRVKGKLARKKDFVFHPERAGKS